MHHKVLSVLLLNVLASLGLNPVNKCVEQVNRYAGLTPIERCLGSIELGKQTVCDTMIVDESLVCSMLDTCSQGRNGWFMDTNNVCLSASRSRSEQTDPDQRHENNLGQDRKAVFHHGIPPFWFIQMLLLK
jgi:hypothetical protein